MPPLAGAAAVSGDAAARHLLAADPVRLDLAATAARYGLVHAGVLVALALALRGASGAARALARRRRLVLRRGAGAVLRHARSPRRRGAGLLAPLVPLGGMLFIAGWAALLVHAVVPRQAGASRR